MNKKPTYDELLSLSQQLEKRNKDLEKELKKMGSNKNNIIREKEDNLLLYNEILDNMAEGVLLVRISDTIIVYTNSKFDEMIWRDEY